MKAVRFYVLVLLTLGVLLGGCASTHHATIPPAQDESEPQG